MRLAGTIAAAIAAALSMTTAPALGATAGQVLLTGGLPLPLGAIAGADSGYSDDSASNIALSATGRYVAFVSDADTLAPGINPDVTNVFRKDRQTGAVVLVGRATGANGAAAQKTGIDPRISDDGSRVAWLTKAALVPADADGGAEDIYVRDIPTATTFLASQGNGGIQTASDTAGFDISGNGQYVVFDTEDALAGAADANAASDVYRRDLAAATTVLASRDSGGTNASGGSDPAISGDGRWVAFASSATNVIASYSGGGRQVYARDMSLGAHYLVSNQTGVTTTGGNGESSQPRIAGTPSTAATVIVAYTSSGFDLAPGGVDGDGTSSIYRRQLSSSSSSLISRATGAAGANADSRAHDPSISDDGQRIVFTSDATNLTASPVYYGVYLRDLSASTTVLGSTKTVYSVQGALSGDGQAIAWFEGQGLTPDADLDLKGVYVRTWASPSGALGPVQYVSRPAGSAPFLATAFPVEKGPSGARTISGDGRYVVFKAWSSRLPSSGPGGQVYRRDTRTGALDLVSRANGASGAPAAQYSDAPTVSADGNRVAFTSGARLHPTDTDDLASVYVRDLATGTTTLVSRATGGGGANADANASRARISADGRHVLFVSTAGNLGVAGGTTHLFMRDLATNTTVLVDRATGAGGVPGSLGVDTAAPSSDGRYVAFASQANNLHPDDAPPNMLHDVYVRDTVASTTTLVSRRSGVAGQRSTATSSYPAISGDGRLVAFRAEDETLAPEAGPWGGSPQVVARSLTTHANTLVSRAPGGAPANASVDDPSVSGNGAVVAFTTYASNLLAGRGGQVRPAVFARTMSTGALSGPPAFGLIDNRPQNNAMGPSLSDDGQCMAFTARGHNAFTGTAGDFQTGYVYVISGSCPKPAPIAALTQKAKLTKVSLKNKRFQVTKKRTAKVAAKRKRKAPKGTAFRFTLNVRANVTIRMHRQLPGRRVGKACRKPSPRLRDRKRCKRYVLAGALSRRGLEPGRRSVAFSGRIGKKALRPGRYRAALYAANSAGKSPSVRLAFTVVRR